MAKTNAGRARSARRSRGRFSRRLSNTRSSGRHQSFRVDPSFFRFVLDSITEYAVLTMDRDLMISSWSRGAQIIFGYAEDEIIGQPVARLFVEEDLAAGYPEREFDEALAKGRVADERWHCGRDGRRFWSYGLSFPLVDASGAARGFVKIVRDETARRRSEHALVEKEERLRLAAEATGMGTLDYDPDRGSVELSERCREILGLHSAKATYDAFLSRVHPADRDRVDDAVRACLEGRARLCDVAHRLVDGREGPRWATLVAKALPLGPSDGRRRQPRLIGALVDSSARKKAELLKEDSTANLERLVAQRTASLAAANKELETFAYSASHDLRAPLRKMKLFSEALLASQRDRLDEQGRDYLRRIQASCESMHSLIDATLELNRAVRKELDLADVDLSRLAAEVSEGLAATEPRRRVRFEIQPGLRARGDKELLSMVLTNLLENAWKFTARRRDAVVAFGSRLQGGAPVFFVRDNGVGFDMKHAGKLFRAFERLHPVGEFRGTGVGLGIVERAVRRHQGRVWAESGPDRGATFYFTLFSERL